MKARMRARQRPGSRSRRWLAAGIFFGALGAGVAICWPARAKPAAEEPAGKQHGPLENLLLDLRRTWQPRPRERLLQNARATRGALQGSLLGLLSLPEHPLLLEAIRLSADVTLLEARPLLDRHARSGPLRIRPAAVTAAHALAFYSREQLAEFLTAQPDAAMTAAVLDCAARGDGLLLEQVVPYVAHEDALVRSAADRALRRSVQTGDLGRAIELALSASGPVRLATLRAFSDATLDARVDVALVQALDDHDPQAKDVALDSLLQLWRPLPDAGNVRRLSQDESAGAALRSKALYLLEKTRAVAVEELPLSPLPAEPLVRYHVARCLVSVGDPKGTALLVDLVAQGHPSGDAELVVGAARKALSSLSGKSVYSDVQVFEDWQRSRQQLAVRPLPQPPGW
jgi:hypothetical protein